MNDTLDCFAVSQIDNFVQGNLLETQKNRSAAQDILENLQNGENSISFDDSIFLDNYNSQIFECAEIVDTSKSLCRDGNNLLEEDNSIETSREHNTPLQVYKSEAAESEDIETESGVLTDIKGSQRDDYEEDRVQITHPCSDQRNASNEKNSEMGNQIRDSQFTASSILKTEDGYNNLELTKSPCGDLGLTKSPCVNLSSTKSPSVDLNFIKSPSVNLGTRKIASPFSIKDIHHLSSWGLPELVLKSYEKRNITSMFDWQLECLNKNNIMEENKNLVYSAPTSAGKTLVAEILAIKCLFERKKKDILSSSGKRVEGFMGSYNPPGGFQSIHMAVGTIEKCNSLVNRLLAEDKLEEIGLVIIDEMHLIGDSHRGYLLELLLTKLKYVMSKNDKVQIQIVGMSATLPNLNLLAEWLNADLYTTNFRPIPLHEMVYVNGELYNNEFKLLRQLKKIPELAADTDDVLQLCLETIENSCSVLMFCPTKNWCENLAQQIAKAFWTIGKSDTDLSRILRKNLSIEKITEILEQLKYCPSGLDKVLKNTVAFGVAFHHAGLTMEERDIVEGGFRNGGIKLLIATSTLSSGVNLPARRVIIRSPLFNGKPIDILTYRQMVGRAGRMGIDTEGQSILICQKSDYNTAKSLTQSPLKPVRSCLEEVGKFKRAILEIIASGVASSPDDLYIFEKCTLISAQSSDTTENIDPVTQVVEFLKNFQFIRLQAMEDGTSKYFPTALGKACLTSSLPPGEGLELFTELEKARQCLVLETELHLIYLVTPYSVCYQWSNIDWMFYLDLWEKLSLSMKKVGELVGVRESFIINATRGKVPDSPKLFIHKRFFVALALQDLVNEKPLDEVAAKFSCNRGMLQSLQQSASTFAGMVTSFSKQLGWSTIEILISQFQDRLQFGVNRDLLDLMRLPCLNSKQARAFYNSGIETLIQLANSDECTIENILHKVVPFENIKEREDETEHEFKQRNKLRTIWITGRQGLTEREAAVLILKDAREYLESEMGVKDIKWGCVEEEGHQEPDGNEVSKPMSLNYTDRKNDVTEKIRQNKHDVNSSINLVLTDSNRLNERNEATKTNKEELRNMDTSINNKENAVGTSIMEKKESTPHKKHDLMVDIKNFENLKIISPQRSVKKVNSNGSKVDFTNKSKQANGIMQSNISMETLNASRQSSTKSNNTSYSSFSEDDLFHESLEETIDKVSSLSVDSKKRIYEPNMSPHLKKQKIEHPSKNEDTEVSNLNFTTLKGESVTPIDLSQFNIIEVCKYRKLYLSFCEELSNQVDVSLALACRPIEEYVPAIGLNLEIPKRNEYKYSFQNKKVDGVAFTWDGKNVFYLYLEDDGCDEKAEVLQEFLENRHTVVKMFECKECVSMINKSLQLEVSNRIEDPKIVEWMLDPDGKERDFHSMISKYCPEAKGLSLLMENCRGTGGLGMNVENTIEPRMRAAVEATVTWTLMRNLKEILVERFQNGLSTYEIEMAATLSVCKMEIAGIEIDMNAMQSLISTIKLNASSIQRKIYSIAGRRFSLTSSKEVAKVIGLGSSRKASTNKQILEQSKHPAADFILLWRKLSCTLSKMLQPLLEAVKNNRIYGKCIMRTATGRISMHEPNVQNVAKDFQFINPITNETVHISCRSIFVPRAGCVFLSADYCQLELRMLAHLSGDELLCRILNSKGDIFKSIAAKWNRTSEDLVTDAMRTHTKHICYGIIYGIGSKALAEQLKVEMEEAAIFMENFKNTYPGIKTYIQTVIDDCKSNGYVETLSGRRRNLPLIEDDNPAIRSHAERQAVNTTIQGSAADLVKKTMKRIEESFNCCFKKSEKPTLVLHLHDELLFEINKKHLTKTARLIKEVMESSVSLSVPFPVKLKIGDSWGSLAEECDILKF